jgi:transcriptional regulator with XRE-family HTH domain
MKHDSRRGRRSSGTQPIMTSFGGRIRFERQSKGWSQADLAKASGLSSDDVARIENGEEAVSFAIALRVAAALGVTVAQLAHAAPDASRMTRRGVG